MICPSCHEENHDQAVGCFSCGHQFAPAIRRGTLVGSRYEVLERLGSGGMGTVYKAHDRVLDETVALKVLRAEVARAPDMERRFRSEIKLARRVRHANVCGIHEYGEDGALCYISMELIEGTDLKQVIRRDGQFPLEEAYDILIQLAEGLQAIHDVGIIHRDLKTANVMRDRRGVVRLMDFGIAKQLGSDASATSTVTGLIMGTPEYMSPEQARSEPLDPRSDIYALGIVIYEIFTGHVPFHGDTPVATLLKQVQEPPPLDPQQASGIPAPLGPVLKKALAKDPAERHATVRELIADLRQAKLASLEALTANVPVAAAPTVPPFTGRPTKLPSQQTVPPKRDDLSDLTARAAVTLTTARGTEQRKAPTRIAAPTTRDPAPRVAPVAVRSIPEARFAGSGTRAWLVPVAILGLVGLIAVGGVLVVSGLFPSTPTSREPASTTTPGRPSMATSAAAPSVPALAASEHPEPAASRPPPPALSVSPESSLPSAASRSRDETPSEPTRSSATNAKRESPASVAGGASTLALPSPVSTPSASAPSSGREAAPTAVRPPEPVASGSLQVVVRPWAEVSVDGSVVGTSPFRPLSLATGLHTVVLSHPDYKPFQRKVTIRPNEVTRLEVDLSWEAFRR